MSFACCACSSEGCTSGPCTERTLEAKELIQVSVNRLRVFSNPVDRATSRRKGTERAEEPKTPGKPKQQNIERHFDLGCLEDEYEPDPKWNRNDGYGSMLKKYLHKTTKMPRAVLSINKARIPREVSTAECRKQLELLCKVDHPNIVPFRECFESQTHLRLVYDWCAGGPLILQLWRYEGQFTEKHVSQVFQEVLAALASAHKFGLHHLGLSLFSLFLGFDDRLSPIKLFGLGLAGFLLPLVTRHHASHTNKHFYVAPDLFYARLKNMGMQTRHACDTWSVGALLYTMCCGRPPFGLGSINELEERIMKADFQFGVEFAECSPSLLELIEELLVRVWQRRLTAEEALGHSFLSKTATLQVGKNGQINSLALKQLNAFVAQDHVKQTLARLLADIGISDDLFTKLEQDFREIDLNNDGTITLDELTQVAAKMPGMTQETLDQIVAKLDRNGNCTVDISEFVAALVMEQEEADEQLIEKAFKKMDSNGDARITKAELFSILKQYSGSIDAKEVSHFIGQSDKDGDQKIDMSEFKHLFPQIKDKYGAMNKRMADCRKSIEQGLISLNNFRHRVDQWVEKIVKKREQIEYSCNIQNPPIGYANLDHYSYDKGHLTEWEVQTFILDVVEILEHPPGYTETKAMRKQRKEAQARQENKETGVIGAMTLSRVNMRQEVERKSRAPGRKRTTEKTDIETLEDMVHHKLTAVEEWTMKVKEDRKLRMADPTYSAENHIQESMYWLVHVKSARHWVQPLQNIVKHMRNHCIQDLQDVIIFNRNDLMKLKGGLDENYRVKDDYEFGTMMEADQRYKIKRGCQLLPLEALKGKNLKLLTHLEKMEEMDLPVHFVFGYAKYDVTQQMVTLMQVVHHESLIKAAEFITGILQNINALFDEVEEDVKMASCVEGLMGQPPNLSQLYLPFCDGRKVADDAATPRSDGAASGAETDASPQRSNSSRPVSPHRSNSSMPVPSGTRYLEESPSHYVISRRHMQKVTSAARTKEF